MDATGFSIEDKTKQQNSLAETSSLVVSLFILLLIVLLYGIISLKLYKKNQFDMEPMHVFQLNFMVVSTLRVIFWCTRPLSVLTRALTDDQVSSSKLVAMNVISTRSPVWLCVAIQDSIEPDKSGSRADLLLRTYCFGNI